MPYGEIRYVDEGYWDDGYAIIYRVSLCVPEDDRTLVVPEDLRAMIVPLDSRGMTVPLENRTMTVGGP
jgi:hypothetical protein